jgi:hypothetical protein
VEMQEGYVKEDSAVDLVQDLTGRVVSALKQSALFAV